MGRRGPKNATQTEKCNTKCALILIIKTVISTRLKKLIARLMQLKKLIA